MPNILAIDQSTSATKAVLFDEMGRCLDRESREHRQYYPQPGWVEHDAEEIWRNVLAVTRAIIARQPEHTAHLAGISLTNQRETVVVFERDSGRPLHPAIVWQCRRSNDICSAHEAAGQGRRIRARTGLRLDAYFSGSKMQWLTRNRPEIAAGLMTGDALIGTIDAYLVYRLTAGDVFATDSTNASRTLLYDIHERRWSRELCSLWDVPLHALPEVRTSADRFGMTTLGGALERPCPIVGVMGDSQASLFGQRCFEPGTAKVTFGTGSSVLLNIGHQPQISDRGTVTALAWELDGEAVYAFEGIIIHSAATLNWLQNQLGLVENFAEIEALAGEVDDTGGVYLVPAFSGLGFPHWMPEARAIISGLSGYSDRRHLARAALESMAFQLRDALDVMQRDSGIPLRALHADGGATANQLLMQFTADITRAELTVTATPDCSALGASLMGMLGLGIHESTESIGSLAGDEQAYQPDMAEAAVQQRLSGWEQALGQVLSTTIHPDRLETHQ